MRFYEISYLGASKNLDCAYIIACSMIEALQIFEKELGEDYNYEAIKCECLTKYNDKIIIPTEND